MSAERKVCTECGNDTFFRRIFTYGEAVVTSNDDVLSQTTTDTALTGSYVCVSCGRDFATTEELTTEAFYHEVIATGKKDALPKLTIRQNHLVWQSDITFVKISGTHYNVFKNKTDKMLPKNVTQDIVDMFFAGKDNRVLVIQSLIEDKFNFGMTWPKQSNV